MSSKAGVSTCFTEDNPDTTDFLRERLTTVLLNIIDIILNEMKVIYKTMCVDRQGYSVSSILATASTGTLTIRWFQPISG
jgi:hypothetical protein